MKDEKRYGVKVGSLWISGDRRHELMVGGVEMRLAREPHVASMPIGLAQRVLALTDGELVELSQEQIDAEVDAEVLRGTEKVER